MNPTCRKKILALLLGALSAISLLVGGWAGWQGSAGNAAGIFGSLLGGGAGLATAWFFWRQLSQEQNTFRYLAELAERTEEDFFTHSTIQELSGVWANGPCYPGVQKLTEALDRLCAAWKS